jgi:hypothetical protein
MRQFSLRDVVTECQMVNLRYSLRLIHVWVDNENLSQQEG